MNFKKLFALLVVASSAAGLQANGTMAPAETKFEKKGNTNVYYLHDGNENYVGSVTVEPGNSGQIDLSETTTKSNDGTYTIFLNGHKKNGRKGDYHASITFRP